jgi:hypothetical protein
VERPCYGRETPEFCAASRSPMFDLGTLTTSGGKTN